MVDIIFVSSALMRDNTWRVSEHYKHSALEAMLFSMMENMKMGHLKDVKSLRAKQLG